MRLAVQTLIVDLPGIGLTSFQVPELVDAYPHELKEAIARRCVCTTERSCPCGVNGEIVITDDGTPQLRFPHETDCPAAEPNLQRLAEEAGLEVPESVR